MVMVRDLEQFEKKKSEGKDRFALLVEDMTHTWEGARSPVLDIKTLSGMAGEKIFIEGPSGCGKSTLLSILAGITLPTSGNVTILGKNLRKQSSSGRDAIRADHIGVIFQMFNLLPYLSVLENVTLPCFFSDHRKTKALASQSKPEIEAVRLLARMGLDSEEIFTKRVSKLSVGQQQRVAAARALMCTPEIIIADEPTSSLDAANTESFLEILFEECLRNNSCLVFASHEVLLAPLFDKTVTLSEQTGASAAIHNPDSMGVR